MEKWYLQEPKNPNIISSRIRLARNLNKYPFSAMLSSEQAATMINETVSTVRGKSETFGDYLKFKDLTKISDVEQYVLLESHMISLGFLKKNEPKALMYLEDESLSIMLNEEDHIRIQAIFPGDDIDAALELTDKADNLIEESLEYAFDKDFGYLTSCPTNTGTGMRASFMVHLPILEKTGNIKSIISPVTKFGMTIRGTYGEGSEPIGSIYQISNQITMGKSEDEILSALKNVTYQITENENALRTKALNYQRIDLEDTAYRSLGILKNVRKISLKEAMSLLSDIKLGITCGFFENDSISRDIYNIMMNIQPGNLQVKSGKELSEIEAMVFRAEYIRNTL